MIGADRSASPPGVRYSKLHECLHVLPNGQVAMRETSKQDVTITAGSDAEIIRPIMLSAHTRVSSEGQCSSLMDTPAFGPDFVTDLPPVFVESQGFVFGCSYRHRHGQYDSG